MKVFSTIVIWSWLASFPVASILHWKARRKFWRAIYAGAMVFSAILIGMTVPMGFLARDGMDRRQALDEYGFFALGISLVTIWSIILWKARR